MAEVFTISGSNFGATIGAHIDDDAPAKTAPASAPVQLQNALVALGSLAGDPKLSGLSVDGVIGKNTVAAVNYALANYVGATSAFPRADLTLPRVRQNAGGLAALIIKHVQSHGGTVPTPSVHRAAAHHRSSAPSPAEVQAAAAAAMTQDPPHPNLVWWVAGGALAIVALGFFVSHRKKKAAASAAA